MRRDEDMDLGLEDGEINEDGADIGEEEDEEEEDAEADGDDYGDGAK